MNDDGVHEIHGVRALTFKENPKRLLLTVREADELIVMHQDVVCEDVQLTEHQARYLAAKLYRLARRIRQRAA